MEIIKIELHKGSGDVKATVHVRDGEQTHKFTIKQHEYESAYLMAPFKVHERAMSHLSADALCWWANLVGDSRDGLRSSDRIFKEFGLRFQNRRLKIYCKHCKTHQIPKFTKTPNKQGYKMHCPDCKTRSQKRLKINKRDVTRITDINNTRERWDVAHGTKVVASAGERRKTEVDLEDCMDRKAIDLSDRKKAGREYCKLKQLQARDYSSKRQSKMVELAEEFNL
jgi:hypothetical protein